MNESIPTLHSLDGASEAWVIAPPLLQEKSAMHVVVAVGEQGIA